MSTLRSKFSAHHELQAGLGRSSANYGESQASGSTTLGHEFLARVQKILDSENRLNLGRHEGVAAHFVYCLKSAFIIK